jgi:hypothetical protein
MKKENFGGRKELTTRILNCRLHRIVTWLWSVDGCLSNLTGEWVAVLVDTVWLDRLSNMRLYSFAQQKTRGRTAETRGGQDGCFR